MTPVLTGQHIKFVIEIVLQIYYRAQSHRLTKLLTINTYGAAAAVEDDDDELNGCC